MEVMNKIPAACSLDWSLDLEKSLRSGKPDKCIQAIEELGSRLDLWNTDSEIPTAACTMFALIPGEDKLFLNAIFLRLIDAFRVGDKQIKHKIATLFLRLRMKRRVQAGIMSKDKLENYLELLSKVKQVYDVGDAEERALALVLFGCWPYLVVDCVDVRYIILASLVSSEVLEVKAGVFAAGCLSELSDDFAFVFLEVLAAAVLPVCISTEIVLAVARSFSKLCHSFTLADKAYKTGSRLLYDSDGDDFSALMLISLTRIASKWVTLIPAQIDLLTLYLSQERSLHLQQTSLRCHQLILARGACYSTPTYEILNKLFGILSTLELQPLHIQAFKLFHKILLITVSEVPIEEITEIFHKLLAVATDALKSSTFPVRTLAISILVDFCGTLLERADSFPVGPGGSVAHLTISFILDRILVIVTISCADIKVIECSEEFEVKSLLRFLFNLFQRCPYVPCVFLKNISFFIGEFIKIIDKKIAMEQNGNQKIDRDDKALVESETLVFVSKIVVSCMRTLEENDDESLQVLDDLKRQAVHVWHCGFFGYYTCLNYVLLLHGNSSIFMQREKLPLSRNPILFSRDSIFKLDLNALDLAKCMFVRSSYYSTYKAGKRAVCQGAWSTAAFIFEQLVTKVQSAACSSWLRFLLQFSTSERQLQLFHLTSQGTFSVPLDEGGGFFLIRSPLNYVENLLRAANTLSSAGEILEPSESRHRFTFQRWFLNLRAMFLKLVADVIKLLSETTPGQNVAGPGNQVERNILHSCGNQKLGLLMHTSMELSRQMNRLAQNFDLLLTSFMVMDPQSRMTILAFALTCSLIAVSVDFSFLVPDWNHSGCLGVFVHENQPEPIHSLLVSDLIVRLRPTDIDSRKKLLFLLKRVDKDKSYNLQWLQNRLSSVSPDTVCLKDLCEYSVGEIFKMQQEFAGVQCNGDVVSQIIKRNSDLLLNVVSKTMLIPFQTPEHFFRARSAASAELFVLNEDRKSASGTSILSGEQLSLNLCLQIRNHFNALPNKVYCIITSEAQSRFVIDSGNCEREAEGKSEVQQIDDMTDLNGKLWKYVIGCADNPAPRGCESSTVNEYLCFQLSEHGQGFTTCLLDVSKLPSGSYRIKWHSGFIDDGGSYWSLLPLNSGLLFNIVESITERW